MSFSQLTSLVLTGIVSDRFGNRRPLVAIACIAALGAAVAAFASNIATLAVAVALVGLGAGVWTLVGAAVAADFGSEGFGRTFSIFTCVAMSCLFAGFGVAKAEEASGTYAPALLVLAALALVGAFCGLLRRERPGARLTAAQKAAIEETAPPIGG